MKVLWMIFPVLFLATSAFAQNVKYSFDTKAEFSKFKTYRWEKHPKSVDVAPETMRQMGASFDAELAKKGLKRKDTGPTDLVIVFQLAFTVDEEVTYYKAGWNALPTFGAVWYTDDRNISTSNVGTEIIPYGALDLDIFETVSQTLVWRGVVTKSLDVAATPEKRQKNIALAASKLLKKYPPNKK